MPTFQKLKTGFFGVPNIKNTSVLRSKTLNFVTPMKPHGATLIPFVGFFDPTPIGIPYDD